MKHVIRSTTGTLLAATLAAMSAAGCATKPPASEVATADAAIGNAGQAIDQATANPHVTRYASSELQRAGASLDRAKAAWHDKHDLRATTHFAYMAQQRAATAQELANERASEEVVKVAAAQRDAAVAASMAYRQTKPPAKVQGLAAFGFGFGKATLPPKAMAAIDSVANAVKDNPGRMVVIEGHTDNVGSPDYNQELAMERADAVRIALIRRGIDSSRITVRALGEQSPLASNDSSAGRSENRRAEVMIADMDSTMTGSSRGAGTTTSSGK